MLQPHGDVKPIEDWWCGDAGGGQGQPQASAPIGETGQHRSPGSANAVERSADQRHDVCLSSGHGCEHLPAASLGLGVAKLYLQMSLPLLTAADERRVHADGDRRC